MKEHSIQKPFWPLYWAIHKYRFKKETLYTDKETGKQYELHYFGMQEIRNNIFLSVFNGLLWIFPAITTILFVLMLLPVYPMIVVYGILFMIAYHFAGMYYVIKGPMLELRPVKKKGFFRRK